MKKISTAIIAATIFSASALAMSDTADARWGYGGYRGIGYGGYRGVGYRGYGYRGVGYRGYGYRGMGYGGYGYGTLGYGNAGYGYPSYANPGYGYANSGYPGYGVGTAMIVVAPTFYYPVYYYGYTGCGCCSGADSLKRSHSLIDASWMKAR